MICEITNRYKSKLEYSYNSGRIEPYELMWLYWIMRATSYFTHLSSVFLLRFSFFFFIFPFLVLAKPTKGESNAGIALGGDFGRSVTTFSAPKAPKNMNFWKFLGKIGFSDQFLALQEPKILRNFGILVKNRPILWKLKILLHNHV